MTLWNALQLFYKALLPLRHTCIRVKQHANPWAVTGSVCEAKHLRDKLYHRALSSGTVKDWQQFRSFVYRESQVKLK